MEEQHLYSPAENKCQKKPVSEVTLAICWIFQKENKAEGNSTHIAF